MLGHTVLHAAPPHPNEAQRLRALRGLELLDTPPESNFDDLCELASVICGAPIALVSLVDAERQWFKAAVGFEQPQTSRNDAICAHAILSPLDVFTIADTSSDIRTATNSLVMGDDHVRFYAGAPLRTRDGHAVGTLCVLDKVPRSLTAEQQRALRTLANQIETQLDLRAAALELARREAELRMHRDLLARSHDANAQFLKKIISETPVSIFTLDLDGNYVVAEGGTLASHGATASSIAGRSALKLYKHAPEALEAIDRGLAGETVLRVVHFGSFIYEVRLAPLVSDEGTRIGVLGLALDITVQRRAEERLELHRRARETLATASSLSDAAPEILRTLCAGGGWGGATVWTLHGDALARESLVLEEPPSGIDFVGNIRAVWDDGTPRWVLSDHATAALFAIRSDDETVAVVKLHSSAHKPEDADELASFARLGAQMGEHLARRRAKEELRLSLAVRKLRDDMSAMIVHDLKNPLAAVIANLGYLVSIDDMPAEAIEATLDANTAANRTLRLIMGLLTEVRLDAGTLAIERQALDVASFLRGILAPRRRLFERYGIELVVDLERDFTMRADAELLARVIENLLDNASRYTAKKGQIGVFAVRTGSGVRISICNTGAEIPPEVRDLIFAKFGQAPSDRQGRGNLGIGLYFCRTAMDAHGGTIRVASDERWPVRFEIEVPA